MVDVERKFSTEGEAPDPVRDIIVFGEIDPAFGRQATALSPSSRDPTPRVEADMGGTGNGQQRVSPLARLARCEPLQGVDALTAGGIVQPIGGQSDRTWWS